MPNPALPAARGRACGPVGMLLSGMALLTMPDTHTHAAELDKLVVTATPLSESSVTIDGRLDEAAWRPPASAHGFVQQTPSPGAPAAGSTAVWVAYDAEAFYVGVRLDDPRPDLIQADERHRDADLTRSDVFEILIDTYHDHQNGFVFSTNPLGAQYDATFTREGAFLNDAWNGVWDVASAQTPTGWSAEFRIPFATLRFHPKADTTWGIQFRRVIPHLLETSLWNPLTPEQSVYEILAAATSWAWTRSPRGTA